MLGAVIRLHIHNRILSLCSPNQPNPALDEQQFAWFRHPLAARKSSLSLTSVRHVAESSDKQAINQSIS